MIAKAKNRSGGGPTVRPMRRSGIELLRIIAMLIIILYHFCYYSGMQDIVATTETFRESFFDGIGSFGRFGVAIFFIITGYFLCKRDTAPKVKKKVWPIIRVALFYFLASVILSFIFMRDSLKVSFPLQENGYSYNLIAIFSVDYWFISAFVLLMIFSPFIKEMLDKLSDKKITQLCLIVVLLSSVAMDFFRLLMISESGLILGGFPIPVPFVYSLVGYTIARREKEIKTRGWAAIFLLIGAELIMLAPIVTTFYVRHGWGAPTHLFRGELATGTAFAAIGCFIIFMKMKWQNRFVNYVASLTLAVYLVHNNPFTKAILFTDKNRMRIVDFMYNNGNFLQVCLTAIAVVLVIFVACCIIEIVRRLAVRAIIRLCTIEKAPE